MLKPPQREERSGHAAGVPKFHVWEPPPTYERGTYEKGKPSHFGRGEAEHFEIAKGGEGEEGELGGNWVQGDAGRELEEKGRWKAER